MMGLLIILASVILDVYLGMKQWSAVSSNRLIARAAAAAGIDDATYNFLKKATWAGPLDVLTPCGSRYRVTVLNNGAAQTPTHTPDGRTLPAGWAYVTSVGTFSDAEITQEALLDLTAGNVLLKARW